jgi:hypothetical protein
VIVETYDHYDTEKKYKCVSWYQKYSTVVIKEILNSDGQQFNQYQQNERLPLTWNHWTTTTSHWTKLNYSVNNIEINRFIINSWQHIFFTMWYKS